MRYKVTNEGGIPTKGMFKPEEECLDCKGND